MLALPEHHPEVQDIIHQMYEQPLFTGRFLRPSPNNHQGA
jgi:hypothetical protein